MSSKHLYGLFFYSFQEHTCDIKHLIFVSYNEKSLISLQHRLSCFCLKNESFKVVSLGCPTLKEDGVYEYVNESYSDFEYVLHRDVIFEFGINRKLNEDERINTIKIINNPNISQINEFCRYYWSFNDYQKRLGIINRIKKAKNNGEYWQNHDHYIRLENLL